MNALSSGDFTQADDPFALFALWLAEAAEREANDPDAMTLASVDADGLPDARMVLCKGADERGLVFYTNAESAKGRELAATPKAAALFHWKSLRRQVQFARAGRPAERGRGRRLFRHAGSRDSRIGAWASQQSRPLEFARQARRGGRRLRREIRRSARRRAPPIGAATGLTPVEIEFWQDGKFRLHDRVVFTRAARARPGGGSGSTLAPRRSAPKDAMTVTLLQLRR